MEEFPDTSETLKNKWKKNTKPSRTWQMKEKRP